MPSDRDYLTERLAFVEQQLENPDRAFVPAGRGRVRRRLTPATRVNLDYKREALLLRKLLARTREDRALDALRAWRRQLGNFLTDHRRRYKAMQRAYDDWWQLPPYQRLKTPQPPEPPPPRLVDHDGAPWIVDDRLLALLDDLIERLQKWHAEP